MKLEHRYTWLWKESGLLDTPARDKYDLLQPFTWYIKQLPGAAQALALKKPIDNNTYTNYYGWMGEVMAEFWLKKFGHRYDLQTILDTSDNQFNRGFDFAGSDIFANLPIQVQVKMKSSEFNGLTREKLMTFMDEGRKAAVLPQNLILMVPSFFRNERISVLSEERDFHRYALKRFIIITGKDMQREINTLPSDRAGDAEFMHQFSKAVNA